MKFVHDGENLVLATAPDMPRLLPDPADIFAKSLTNANEWAFDKFVDMFIKFAGGIFKSVGEWFITHLPDIVGYLTVTAGICIIIGAMIGRGGMMKPLAIYAAVLIFAVLLLGGS